jgi:hypothetical protein
MQLVVDISQGFPELRGCIELLEMAFKLLHLHGGTQVMDEQLRRVAGQVEGIMELEEAITLLRFCIFPHEAGDISAHAPMSPSD